MVRKSGLNIKGRKKGHKRKGKDGLDLAALDESILEEIEGLPAKWISLIREMLMLSRPYAGVGTGAIIQTGDFNRLIVDKLKLSALNERLAVISGILEGRSETAHHIRKIAYSRSFLEVREEAESSGTKLTGVVNEATAETRIEDERMDEGQAIGLNAMAERLMHRTNGIVNSLESACQILQREMAQAGGGE